MVRVLEYIDRNHTWCYLFIYFQMHLAGEIMLHVIVAIWPGGDKMLARAVAVASITNLSDLADVSDYALVAAEGYNPLTGALPWSRRGQIHRHDRRSSVWALVAKAAAWASESARSEDDADLL